MEKINLGKTKEQILLKGIWLKNKIDNILNNERGDGLLAGLIFTALIVLAVVAMKTSIEGGFADLGTWFKDTVIKKVTNTITGP